MKTILPFDCYGVLTFKNVHICIVLFKPVWKFIYTGLALLSQCSVTWTVRMIWQAKHLFSCNRSPAICDWDPTAAFWIVLLISKRSVWESFISPRKSEWSQLSCFSTSESRACRHTLRGHGWLRGRASESDPRKKIKHSCRAHWLISILPQNGIFPPSAFKR